MGQSNVALTAALTNVRSMLDEPTAQFWSDSELTLWLNEGCTDVARTAEILRQEVAIAVTADTQSYPAPADVYRIYRVEFVPTGAILTYPLAFRGYQGMDQYWGNLQSLPSAFPSLYTLWYSPVGASASPAAAHTQMMIKTYPVPAQAGNLNVFYYRQVVLAAAGTDTLDTLPGWEDIVYDYVVYKALRKDADPRWKDQQAIYDEKLAAMMDTTRSWTDQSDYFSTGMVGGPPAWLVSGEW
jgi:hypothetical protein